MEGWGSYCCVGTSISARSGAASWFWFWWSPSAEGAALAGFAGARRTDTALTRFLTYDRPGDGGFLFGSQSQPPTVPRLAPDSLALAPVEQRVVDLPQVESYFRAPYLFVATRPSGSHVGDLNVLGPADPELFRSMDRPQIITGRLPDPQRADEAVVNYFAAAQSHLRVGSTVRLYAYSSTRSPAGRWRQLSDCPRLPDRRSGCTLWGSSANPPM